MSPTLILPSPALASQGKAAGAGLAAVRQKLTAVFAPHRVGVGRTAEQLTAGPASSLAGFLSLGLWIEKAGGHTVALGKGQLLALSQT